jgi:cation-transporting P-type ATPase I
VGPFAWGQALLAAAVASSVSALALDLLARASENVRRRIIGGERKSLSLPVVHVQ